MIWGGDKVKSLINSLNLGKTYSVDKVYWDGLHHIEEVDD